MNLKYYDILSCLIVGYAMIVVIMYSFHIEYSTDHTVAYLAMAFLFGYIINSLGSLLEPMYYFSIGGKPSKRLLNNSDTKHCRFYHIFIPDCTGINKVHFYETAAVRKILIKGLGGNSPSEDRLFAKAMMEVNGDTNSRVPDFNAQYALSRTILTAVLISTGLIIASYPNNWQSYLSIVVLLICWNRYRERAYYYAREVLNEYLKKNKQ